MRSAILLLILAASGCSRWESMPDVEQPASPQVAETAAPFDCESAVAAINARLDALAKPVEPQPEPLPDEPPPPPPPPVQTTEADYWDAMAELVEDGLVDSTDVLLTMADILKADERLTDLRRIEVWRPARVVIDESNQASIAATLRGK